MIAKKIEYLWDGLFKGHYVQAWKETRDIIVHVWLDAVSHTGACPTEEGLPDGNWAMPDVLGLEGCIEQAISQTRSE